MNKFSVFLISCTIGILAGWLTYPSVQDTILGFAETLEDDYIDIEKQGATIEQIMTNLKDGHYGAVSFQLVGSSEETAEEIKNREFQIKSFVIKELTEMNKEDLQKGGEQLQDSIKKYLNGILDDGEVLDVYITEKLVQ